LNSTSSQHPPNGQSNFHLFVDYDDNGDIAHVRIFISRKIIDALGEDDLLTLPVNSECKIDISIHDSEAQLNVLAREFNDTAEIMMAEPQGAA